jgi:hypothetical protein
LLLSSSSFSSSSSKIFSSFWGGSVSDCWRWLLLTSYLLCIVKV